MPKARQARKVSTDQAKVDADALIDALVNGEAAGALQFAEDLATERARAQRLGMFKLWSIGNRLYIEGQVRRSGAQVRNLFAGPEQWKSMGREVLESELRVTEGRGRAEKVIREGNPFWIQGQPTYTVKVKDPTTGAVLKDPVTGEDQTETRWGGTRIPVYDWTQTKSVVEDYEEPDWEEPLAAGDYATLRQLAASSPIPVTFDNLGGRATHGRYDGTSITIDSTIPVGNQIVELARQLAHHHLDHPVTVRERRPRLAGDDWYSVTAILNSEATLVGWMIAKALGLDEDTDGQVTAQAASYLHEWTRRDKDGNAMRNDDGSAVTLEGTKSRRKLLKARIDAALKATDAILGEYVAAGDQADTPAIAV